MLRCLGFVSEFVFFSMVSPFVVMVSEVRVNKWFSLYSTQYSNDTILYFFATDQCTYKIL